MSSGYKGWQHRSHVVLSEQTKQSDNIKLCKNQEGGTKPAYTSFEMSNVMK